MNNSITFVGVDAHKKNIVAYTQYPDGRCAWMTVNNEPNALKRFSKSLLKSSPGGVRCCYEAGCCGFHLQRQLRGHGVDCIVVAPSMIPRRPGDRIKTDRRDARNLCHLLQTRDMLVEVHPPSEEQEALRDLCRARDDARRDRMSARHRLQKFLVRYGHIYREGNNWTQKYWRWARKLTFSHAASRATYNTYVLSLQQIEARLEELDREIDTIASDSSIAEQVGWLKCFRGFRTTSAVALLAELYCIDRFWSPRKLMAFVGLVPSESSSGDKVKRGPITKAGNSHARRLLVEAAWNYRCYPRVSAVLRRRRQNQPAEVIAIADRAQQRLFRRRRHLLARRKPAAKVNAAIARELVGFIWAALHHREEQESRQKAEQEMRLYSLRESRPV